MMRMFYAILLGLIQGVAEFLPISSSGHLALAELLMGEELADMAENSALFNVLLHLATLVAVIIAYRRDISAILRELGGMIGNISRGESIASGDIPVRRLIVMLLIATLPLVLVLPFHHKIEALGEIPWFIGLALIVTGLMLFISDRLRRGTKTEANITVADAVVIGFAQALATLPGVSRSGTTITAGMGRGLNREFAVRFSFLMSLLAVLGAVLLKVIEALGEGIDTSLLPAYLVGMLVAGVTGYASIRLLQAIIRRGRFGGFAYYCWGVGAVSIILSLLLRA